MNDAAPPPTSEQLAAMRVDASWVRKDAGIVHKFAADVLVLVDEVERLRSVRQSDAFAEALADMPVHRDRLAGERDDARGEVERLLQAERVAISDLEDKLARIVAELRGEAQAQEERGLGYPQGGVRRMHMWISGRLATIADRGGAKP